MNDIIKSWVNQAASEGDIPFLALHREWWNTNTCMYAAMNGHLECLRFLHTQGCEWDVSTCYSAANSGYLECLKYARQHGCPFNDTVHQSAVIRGKIECLKYAYEQLFGEHVNGYAVCVMAINNNQLECLKYAISKTRKADRMWFSLLNVAVEYLHLDCFRYLYEIYVHPKCNAEDPEEFWDCFQKHHFEDKSKNEKLYDLIDLNDEWWRKHLFHLQLHEAPTLRQRIDDKKKEIIRETQEECLAALSNILPLDVIRCVLFAYV